MTPSDFRTIALSLPDTVESSHHGHPDFRVRGKIFATLAHPSRGWGMVALTPAHQARVCRAEPEVFFPVNGAWGRGGATHVYLQLARPRSVRAALKAAWRYRAPTARGARPAAARKGRTTVRRKRR